MKEFNFDDAIIIRERLIAILLVVKTALANYPQSIGGERYLTTGEVCALLKINAGTLQQYRDEHRIGYVKLSKKILYRESDIIRVLNDNYIPARKAGQ